MQPRKAAAAAARVPRVVAVLAGLLERAAERGDAESAEGAAAAAGARASEISSAAAFRGRAVPGIPVRRYAERIYRYAGCSPACFVVAYVYLDRLVARDSQEEEEGGGAALDDGDGGEAAAGVRIDSYSVHRLLITAVLVAAKFMDDRHNNNAYFARVGGVEVGEMNALEGLVWFKAWTNFAWVRRCLSAACAPFGTGFQPNKLSSNLPGQTDSIKFPGNFQATLFARQVLQASIQTCPSCASSSRSASASTSTPTPSHATAPPSSATSPPSAARAPPWRRWCRRRPQSPTTTTTTTRSRQ